MLLTMRKKRRLYPIGTQDFQNIIKGGFVYIDKTEYVYEMTHDTSRYIFLSRPRRFGKSLLTSTLKYFFEGRKDLFNGLTIEKLEDEWATYPVLHFDMSTAKHLSKEDLIIELEGKLSRYEKIYGRESSDIKINQRLEGLIKHAYEKTGRQAVVLIDEYDSPLLDVVHEDEDLPKLRNVMRNFYSPLKACDPYLRFVFITGITKFSQLSVFSELNNIRNISMLSKYAAICGITKEELTVQMKEDIQELGQELDMTFEETLEKLVENYDGYHFTMPSPGIFNPYSLLNAFADKKIDSYWFGSGTPTYLLEMFRKFGVLPTKVGCVEASVRDFDAPTERMTSIVPLLYQAGYLTIKRQIEDVPDRYLLDFPNKEVRLGMMYSLMPEYVSPDTIGTDNAIYRIWKGLRHNDMDTALKALQEFLPTIPYCDNTDYEGHYQQVLYIIFSSLGAYADVEVHTATGRVDMVMRTPTCLYIFELKMNKSAEAAMRQIDLNDYASRFSLSGLPITKVGVNFDKDKRTITDWKIQTQTRGIDDYIIESK